MYEKLLDEALENGITVIEKYPFHSPRIRGLCCDDTIALSEQIDTTAERTVILCEELCHATDSFGNILHDSRAEHRTRQRIFDRLISPERLAKAALAGCREAWEFADWLGVPPAFFNEAMEHYKARFGVMTKLRLSEGLFLLQFEPTLRLRRAVRATDKKRLSDRTQKEMCP